MEIGGDWYDGVPLDDGRIAIAVGDVVGRGLAAATTMGQLRAALAVTAMQADDADDAIRILDRYADRIPGAKCATAAIAIIDPAAETVSYASAGHPPPLLALPDGTVRYLEGGRSWPLRVTASIPRPGSATEPMPAGSCSCSTPTGSSSGKANPSTWASPGSSGWSPRTGTCRCVDSSKPSSGR